MIGMADPLKNRKWLWELLVRYSESYDSIQASAALPPECFDQATPSLPRSKLAIRVLMRQTGLRYGLPLRVPGVVPEGMPAPQAFFLSALAREFDLCGAAALVVRKSLAPETRRRDLIVFLAASIGTESLLERADLLAESPPDDSQSERLAQALARPVWQRGRALSSDPILGLPIHNGLVYSDARFLGRLAVDTYRRGRYSRRVAVRLRSFANRERAALAEALMLLARAEHSPSPAMRRAIVAQLRELGLPKDLWRAVRRALEAPRAPEEIAASIPSKRTRTFLLEQVVLGALADGWRSPKERKFLHKLAQTLGIPEDELARIEADLAEFYAEQPDFVDRFRVQDRLADLREQLLGRLDEIVERNWSVLVYEARQGRELTQALRVLARGGKLEPEQRRRLRVQLLDLAKTIPSLALFAAPGGLLLTIALAKVLPQSFLPSILSGQRRSEGLGEGEGPEATLGSAEPPENRTGVG
jgi:uncharacterized tellurite resistance protein B-like protein